MTLSSIQLADGIELPCLGLGIWQIPDEQTGSVVSEAIDMGYRLIDGAFIYGNEAGLGEGLRAAETKREEVFVTTKVWNTEQGYDPARRAIDASLSRIGVEQLDMVLVHWPCPQRDLYVDTWKALIAARDAGQVRTIGVSNFNTDHLDRLISETGVAPSVNQIEVNPRLQQPYLRADCAKRDIAVQCWTPLGQGASFDTAPVQAAAARLGASPAQIILAWHLSQGLSVIPRSTKAAHLQANLNAAQLILDDAEIAAIGALDEGQRCGPDPESFE